jgi:hypothetical protein
MNKAKVYPQAHAGLLNNVDNSSEVRLGQRKHLMLDFLKTRITHYAITVDRNGNHCVKVTEEFRHPSGLTGWLSRHFGNSETEPSEIPRRDRCLIHH